jgi:5'-AMP-activated protein kinase, catalytic alpha subunit
VLQRGSYSEETAHKCFRQLLEGVSYCHERGVVHRDLKLENLLLETEHDLTRMIIVDFGLAKGHFRGPAMAMDTVCGTPHYVAPEVIQARRLSHACMACVARSTAP